MSAVNEGRRFSRRPSGRHVVIGAVALVVIAAAATVIVQSVTGPNVPKSLATQVARAPQVSANQPIAAAPKAATVTNVVDVTRAFTSDFEGDVADVRSRAQGKVHSAPTAVSDPCLLDWAKGNLAALAAKGAYKVVTVCGRPTAVLAGPAGADAKVLVYGALEESAPAETKKVLVRSSSDRMAFVAVRSADGNPKDQAQLMAAAVLPRDESAPEATERTEGGTTYITEEQPGKPRKLDSGK